MASTRIICCGNPDRGDDAAGLLVARRLRAMGIEAREESGDGLALIASWEGAERVILVDAVSTGAGPGAIQCWNGLVAPVLQDSSACSTHGFGVAEAIKLSRVLGTLPPHLKIYGIEAHNFVPGSAPSQDVLKAAEDVARRIAWEMTQCTNQD